MTNPFFGAPQGGGGGAKFQALGDLAAAEREVEAYFTRLAGPSRVPPEGAVAFGVTPQQAVEAYTRWLNGLSMAPGDLKRFADLGALKAVYVPFWVVHAMTYTTYRGQRGIHYQETETYKDAQGATQTRQVAKTRWEPASGSVTHNFENVLIPGKDAMPADHVALLTPSDLIPKLEPFAAEKHTHAAEPYGVDPKSAFNKARTGMEAEIKRLCAAQIGGDEQKVDSTQTRYVGVSVRHVLVPCYQGTYKYRGKGYDILINGFNGQVTGARPYSAGKIALLVIAIVLILAVVAALVYFLLIGPAMNRQRSGLPETDRPAVACAAPADAAVAPGQESELSGLSRR